MTSKSFIGSFRLSSSNNYEKILKEMGVENPRLGNLVAQQPVVTVTCTDEIYTVKFQTDFEAFNIHFKLDEPYEDMDYHGKTAQYIVKGDDNTWILSTIPQSDSTLKYKAFPDRLEQELIFKDTVCIRIYRRL